MVLVCFRNTLLLVISLLSLYLCPFCFCSSDNQAAGSTTTKATTPAARPKGSVIDLTEDDDDDVQGKKKGQSAFMTMCTSSTIMKENCKMLYCHRAISYAFDLPMFFVDVAVSKVLSLITIIVCFQ